MAVIGIDLGTTNSLAAVWQQGRSRLIPNALGDVLTPSAVSIDEDGTVLVGEAARQRLVSHPERSAAAFKRAMGTDQTYSLAGRTFTPEELSALVLRQLKQDAEAFLGEPVEEAVVSVPGRVEMLPTKTPYRMILDYSHSPDALENILKTVREFCHGRIILVFGCGGDRDKGKRPMMGEIAGRLADYAILTSDNPRFEDPMAILAAIEAGIKPTGAKYEVIENRREAIRQAMEMAVSGDIVVLAGKGHEDYQLINGKKLHFVEREIIKEACAEISK